MRVEHPARRTSLDQSFVGAHLSEQDATEATTASVPEDSGAAATTPTPETTATPAAETSEVQPAEQLQQQGEAADQAEPNGLVVLDDLGGQSFADAVDATIVEFDD